MKTSNFASVGCSLQDEYSRVQAEVKRLRSDRQSQQDKVQLMLSELRGELLDKTREMEELRLQVKRHPQGFCLDCWFQNKTKQKNVKHYLSGLIYLNNVLCGLGDDSAAAGAAPSPGAAGDGGSSQRSVQQTGGGQRVFFCDEKKILPCISLKD